MTKELRLLIVGGYGAFGGRIVELLKGEPRLTLIVAGRSLARATAFCAVHSNARARLEPARFDRDEDVSTSLASLQPAILVDASGPFQSYGEHPYRLVEACVALGVNYLDLADGSDFVAGVGAYNAQARAAGVFVLSGVSSFPVLTAAVVRRLAQGMARVNGIRGGIAPSPFAIVGDNVIRAIAAYAGRRAPLRRDGVDSVGYPFTEQMRFVVAVPGRAPLESRLFSLVDVPDLRVLGTLWPDARTIWMGAAPVPEILHRMLIGLSWLVRWKWLPTLSPLAPLMHFATTRLRWGEHRGGMFVAVDGLDADGRRVEKSWHMLAEGDDGPLIPSMAVEALVRKSLDAHLPPPGARACVAELELEDYERLFARRTIVSGVRDDSGRDDGAPLYARALGTAWASLPAEIRAIHASSGQASGRARVERGSGALARLAAAAIGVPRATDDTGVRVRFTRDRDGETWTRVFGADVFASRQTAGGGRWARLLVERFGPLEFALAPVVEADRLRLAPRSWKAFGLRMPRALCPRAQACEFVADGRFNFFVEIDHPLTGLIARYSGWLTPDAAPSA